MKFKGVENKANPFSLDHYTDEQKAVLKKRDETKKEQRNSLKQCTTSQRLGRLLPM